MANERPAAKSPLPDPDVVAAGAVVLHQDRVLLVHRPRYDDWAFPKGKQDPGEHDTVTAVREVLEETGVEIRLGRPVASRAYLIANVAGASRTKLVHYWLGTVVGDPDVSQFAANSEIDQVEWVPVDKAPQRLTYPDDREVLAAALTDAEPTTPLIVLRHAKATSRKRFHGSDDRDRDLTPTGHRQARALMPVLAAYAVTRVISSSSTRCNDTVLPYAHEHVLGVKETPKLSEESATAESVAAVLRKADKHGEATVICTHRPVLPLVFEALGLDCEEPLRIAEAMVLHRRGGQVVAIERHLPW